MPRSTPSSGRTRRRRPLWRLVGIPVLAIGAALLLTAALAPTASVAAAVVKVVDATWMDFPPLPDDLRELSVRSTITDRDGNRIATVRDENRILVEGDEIPDHVREAVIATEDQDFFDHEGVDWAAVGRAALGNVQAGEVTGGGSTITQQLVKNVVIAEPGQAAAQTIERKVQEAVYAIQLEERVEKDEILTQYLNTAYYANGVYGVATAAEYYWGKHVGDLTVDEAALLAGMLRAPERNNPVTEPEAAEQRRNIVLGQMADVGYLTEDEARELADGPIELDVQEREEERTRDAITDFVIEVIQGREGDDQLQGLDALGATPEERFNQLATGGYHIRTTIHRQLQATAEEAIRAHLNPELGGHAALTVVDPRSGELLAMGFGPQTYGEEGADFHPGVPGLGSPGRSTGSAFKTFAMVAALEDGIPPTYTTDTPSPYTPTGECAQQDSGWRPTNYADAGGGVMDMFQATAVSSNTYFVHLIDEMIGSESMGEMAERLGVMSSVGRNCAAVLGTSDLTGLDMAAAFGTLANEGQRCETHVIAEVVDRNGEVIYEGSPEECDRAVDADVAAQATQLLQGPIQDGTAARHGQIGRPAAGKTGTSQNFGDAWFVGYVPQLSAAVWMGNERPTEPLTGYTGCADGVTGGCTPTQVWSTFMREAVQLLELPAEDFPSPPALPTTTVPDVLGQHHDAAVATLRDAGFSVQAQEVEHHAEVGTVVEQSPGGGTSAPERSTVRIGVSDGTAEPPTMPLVVGLSESGATSLLRGRGFDVDVVEVGVADPDDLGRVVAQSPQEGARVEDGQRVTIEVGRPQTEEEGDESDEGDDEPTEGPSPDPPRSPSPTPAPPPEDDDTDDGGDGDDGDDGDGDADTSGADDEDEDSG